MLFHGWRLNTTDRQFVVSPSLHLVVAFSLPLYPSFYFLHLRTLPPSHSRLFSIHPFTFFFHSYISFFFFPLCLHVSFFSFLLCLFPLSPLSSLFLLSPYSSLIQLITPFHLCSFPLSSQMYNLVYGDSKMAQCLCPWEIWRFEHLLDKMNGWI